jgi:hypothetical protein
MPTYSYTQVEEALAQHHIVGPRERGVLRGRLKTLQKLRLTPASPGKGRRVDYTYDDVLIWAFCLELAQCGLTPEWTVTVARMVGGAIQEEVAAIEPTAGEHKYFVFFPWIMSNAFAIALRRAGEALEGDPRKEGFGYIFLNEATLLAGINRQPRAISLNLTQLKRSLDRALKKAIKSDG